jgi:hypothetical protein
LKKGVARVTRREKKKKTEGNLQINKDTEEADASKANQDTGMLQRTQRRTDSETRSQKKPLILNSPVSL